MATLHDLIVSLETVAPKLPVHLQATAADLATKTRQRRTATERQIRFMRALVGQANGETPRETARIGDMTGVIALFDRAKTHLKAPAVVIAHQTETGLTLIRLKLAGSTSRYEGSITVTVDRGEWLGRIDRTGDFDLNRRARETATAVIPLLTAFAADPATGAKASALLTGRCVFCNTALKDERSTKVGYGKTCAGRYGLAWK